MIPQWLSLWLDTKEAANHYLSHWWPSLRPNICQIKTQWVKLIMMTSSNGSVLLALCEGNSPVIGEFPSQRPVTRSADVFFDLCVNKRLSKHSRRWWFETPSHSLWRHCNVIGRRCKYDWFQLHLFCFMTFMNLKFGLIFYPWLNEVLANETMHYKLPFISCADTLLRD